MPNETTGATAETPTDDALPTVPHDGLCDELGPIPAFGPARTDDEGRIVMGDGERLARASAAMRALKAMAKLPDTDPPGTTEAFMRGFDAERPGRRMFEGMY